MLRDDWNIESRRDRRGRQERMDKNNKKELSGEDGVNEKLTHKDNSTRK